MCVCACVWYVYVHVYNGLVLEQIHRCLMMSSVLVSSAALVLVFVANKDNQTPGLIELCNRVRTGQELNHTPTINVTPSLPTLSSQRLLHTS